MAKFEHEKRSSNRSRKFKIKSKKDVSKISQVHKELLSKIQKEGEVCIVAVEIKGSKRLLWKEEEIRLFQEVKAKIKGNPTENSQRFTGR